jgi:hypothetical protein
MSQTDMATDPWQTKLLEQLKRLKACQADQGLESCLPCAKLLGCATRSEYVKVTYESMSRGKGGGFEF